MTSCRFADGRNADCGAWKERVHLEEKSARNAHARANNPNGSYKSMGVWSMGYDEMKGTGRGPNAQANGSHPSPCVPQTTGSSAGTGSYYSGMQSAKSGSRRVQEVTKRLSELEASLEDEKVTRSEVQSELKELRSLLKQYIAQDKSAASAVSSSNVSGR